MTYRMAFLVGVALSGWLGLETISLAEMPTAAVVAQMKDGKVTAVGKEDIQINGYTYRIMQEAVILDHEGQPLAVEDIRPTGLVKYVLKGGQIQSMIVTNPQ
ncbi:MAG: hypothetical protein E8D47_07245 [Nitrospira sp.]|nr:MAG: hypothetical protein E8D47_07245 [Nitrospira sp.]